MSNGKSVAGARRGMVRTVPSDCEKIAFLTKADAKRFIKKRRATSNFSARHAYACHRGDHWHITSRRATG